MTGFPLKTATLLCLILRRGSNKIHQGENYQDENDESGFRWLSSFSPKICNLTSNNKARESMHKAYDCLNLLSRGAIATSMVFK